MHGDQIRLERRENALEHLFLVFAVPVDFARSGCAPAGCCAATDSSYSLGILPQPRAEILRAGGAPPVAACPPANVSSCASNVRWRTAVSSFSLDWKCRKSVTSLTPASRAISRVVAPSSPLRANTRAAASSKRRCVSETPGLKVSDAMQVHAYINLARSASSRKIVAPNVTSRRNACVCAAVFPHEWIQHCHSTG